MWTNTIVLSILSVAVCSATMFGPPAGSWPPLETTTAEDLWNGTVAPPLVNPCEGVICYDGRSCAVDNNQSPVCVCLNQCYSDTYYSPICGSDNKTYENYCFLQLESCITNSNISYTYGTCPPKTVCDGFVCPSGKICRVDPQVNGPVCVCNQTCDNNLDPVCGSDDVTYSNVCELRKEACFSGTDITVDFKGICNQATVCDGFICPCGRYCAVGQDGQPVCVCNTTCPSVSSEYVCGSDGKTYRSSCDLRMTACLSGADLTVLNPGFCFEGSPCDGFECPPWRQCNVDQNSQPMCVCMRSCVYRGLPVCGSNGYTFSDECSLQQYNCNNRLNLTVVLNGSCPSSCSGVQCPIGMHCELNDVNSTKCVCGGSCSKYYSPVCGSDNRTYDNECFKAEAACNIGTNITTVSNGICPSEGLGCEQFPCPVGMHCEVEADNRASCACNKICPDDNSAVCGSDDRTYYSACELQRFSCMTNGSVAAQGYSTYPCDSLYISYRGCAFGFVKCPQIFSRCGLVNGSYPDSPRLGCACEYFCPDVYAPVCGNDNITYDSNCLLRMSACNNESNATYVAAQRACEDDEPTCEQIGCGWWKHCELDKNNKPVCVCNKASPTYYDPLCASDNKTYRNDYEMYRAGCLADTSISRVFPGTCEKGRGCYSVSCPSGRYCVVDDNNLAHCVCDMYCGYWEQNTYVCGSDNETYGNACLLRIAACLSNTNVTVQMTGSCPKAADNPCNGFKCPMYSRCAIDENLLPTCVCLPNCGNYKSLVCGSDNKTYLNDCELTKDSCMSKSNVTIRYYSKCYDSSICYGVQCTQNTVCGVVDNDQTCVCNDCPGVNIYSWNAICGSDNVTYRTWCDLNRINCVTNSNVTQQSQGTCRFATNCDGVVCPSSRQCALDEENNPICVCTTVTCDSSYNYYNPVCGSDGITYMNHCQLNRQACFENTNTTYAHSGYCN